MADQRLNSFVRCAIGILTVMLLTVSGASGQSRDRSQSVAFEINPIAGSAEGLGLEVIRVAQRGKRAPARDLDDSDAPPKKIIVEGDTGLKWVDTGIDVKAGDIVQLEATGEVDVTAGWGIHGPEGTTKFSEQPPGYYPVESKTRYGLAARITSIKGKEQQKWSYGDTRQIAVKMSGRLWLTVNDDAPEGNEGEYEVTITIIPKKS